MNTRCCPREEKSERRNFFRRAELVFPARPPVLLCYIHDRLTHPYTPHCHRDRATSACGKPSPNAAGEKEASPPEQPGLAAEASISPLPCIFIIPSPFVFSRPPTMSRLIVLPLLLLAGVQAFHPSVGKAGLSRLPLMGSRQVRAESSLLRPVTARASHTMTMMAAEGKPKKIVVLGTWLVGCRRKGRRGEVDEWRVGRLAGSLILAAREKRESKEGSGRCVGMR